jgi:hypothetical protein
LYIIKTGLAKENALRNGPNNKPIWIKIVANRKSGGVLGSQIVGGEGVKERIRFRRTEIRYG